MTVHELPIIPANQEYSRGDSRVSSAKVEDTQTDFYDVLDVVNPLQHIPGVSQVYREVTGDTIDTAASVMGGGLFGGVTGAATSFVTSMIEEANGESMLNTAWNGLDDWLQADDEQQELILRASPTAAYQHEEATELSANDDIVQPVIEEEEPSQAELQREANKESADALNASLEGLYDTEIETLDEMRDPTIDYGNEDLQKQMSVQMQASLLDLL